MSNNWIALGGIAAILALAVAFSTNRKAIRLRVVGAAFGLHLAVAIVVLYWPAGRAALEWLSTVVLAVINYSREGINLVFGGLASDSLGFSFAVNALPIIIFFSALMSVLYHLGIMQRIVRFIGGGLQWIIGTRTVESLNAAANIFVGQTEAPLVVRPYLRGLTEAQMFTVMVSGLASVAGTMLAAYVLLGAEISHIIAASFMAAPGGLLMAKIIMPDEDEGADDPAHLEMEESHHANLIMAAANGATDGVRLAVNIGAMLIAFVSLIALLNGLLGFFGGLFGYGDLTFEFILGWVFAPLMWLLSIPWAEAQAAGALFGEKLVLNEFIAFTNFEEYLQGASEKTRAVVTFSLCGFANFASIAIILGGVGSLVPEKKDLIARLGLRAVAAASLSNLMSAALAGLLLT